MKDATSDHESSAVEVKTLESRFQAGTESIEAIIAHAYEDRMIAKVAEKQFTDPIRAPS